MGKRTRADIADGQVIAVIRDRFDEPRNIVQRGSRIRVANNDATATIAMNREVAIVIGERIRAARLARGLSLEELAIRSGITSGWPKNRMHEIESCTRKQGVRMGTLYAIAAALNVEVSTLLPSVSEILGKAEVQKVTAKMVVLDSRGRVSA
jgi:DNA-binding Xre family transcriptional regulator